MNERIKELLLKAGWDGYEALDERNQKFAQLIVRECAKLRHKNVVVGGVSDYNRGRRELAEEILKHFGVAE